MGRWGRWHLSYETRQFLRKATGAGMIVAGALVTLSYLPAWLWLVAAGCATAWVGVRLLRED